MRGQENPQASMFSYVSLEQRVPKDHPLRSLRALVGGILANMSTLFDERYSHTGRPSIPPEQLLRALLDRPSAWEIVSFDDERDAPPGFAELAPAW